MTEALVLHIRLTPKAARTKIQGWQTDADGRRVLKASVTAVPEKGKANKGLIALLAKELNIAKSDIHIVRGETDRNKVLKLHRVSQDAIDKLG